ncbi:VOC family protein [Lentzea tibetensis]|uniref:VOC family protein n=1 Tax=Lentzea tibetensis TaxID=2591470 RepID=A0A563EN53_9PSEU|nr:VOC family protein [Lentzea tibetensis]TWP48420.1 VOC family protein [Lentzea tibetensis]
MTAHGTINWVQIGTDAPEDAKKFYGELFGWTYADDPHSPGYDLITTPGGAGPSGGLSDTKGEAPNHAVFFVVVSDVAAAAAEAERLGGKVVVPLTTTPDGLAFAHLVDPSGNHFGVYTPAG